MKTVEVLDSVMAYREEGAGDTTIVFLHGNPTSSHLWRNVIPLLSDRARCLAPDLIGMGDSGKPDIDYRFVDHVRYLDAWFDALGLGDGGLDDVVIVGQDWGGALGMDWARRHPDRVRGLALVETFLRPLSWAEMPPLGQDIFRRIRSAEGEQMVLRDNQFIEFNLPHGVQSGLAPADHDVYRAPYPDERSRRPLLAWPREIPFDGEPADVHDRMVAYGEWLAATPQVPKLVMTVEEGVGMGSAETATWAKETFAAVTLVSLGPGGHQAPEDQPEAMGRAIGSWLWA